MRILEHKLGLTEEEAISLQYAVYLRLQGDKPVNVDDRTRLENIHRRLFDIIQKGGR